MQFSSDRRRLFSYAADKVVKVWDTATGLEVLALRQDEQIRMIALSPDGHRLTAVHFPFDGGQIYDATPLREK